MAGPLGKAPEKIRADFDEDYAEWEKFVNSLTDENPKAPLLKDGAGEEMQEDMTVIMEQFEILLASNAALADLLLKRADDPAEEAGEPEEERKIEEKVVEQKAVDKEQALLDFQVNINRMAAEYCQAHDGDMTGFSNYMDNFFAKIDMKAPELREHLLKHTSFAKIETADDDAEFSTYFMADNDEKTAMRNAMLTFYHANPQYDVSDADIQGLDVGAFRNGIVYAPDGRAFSFEQVCPFAQKQAPQARMSM